MADHARFNEPTHDMRATLAIVEIDRNGEIFDVTNETSVAYDVFIPVSPERATPRFDIAMPDMCEKGCHRVYLLCDGDCVGIDRVRNAKEARLLMKRWAREFKLPGRIKRSLRTKMVHMTSHHNATLEKRRRGQ